MKDRLFAPLKHIARHTPYPVRRAVWAANEILPSSIHKIPANGSCVEFIVDRLSTPGMWRLDYDTYEDGFSQLLKDVLKKGTGTFYDVGASYGIYTLLAGSHGWDVHAFEPDPSSRKRLQRNIRRNQDRFTGKVHGYGFALGDKNGETLLCSDGSYGPSPSQLPHGQRGIKQHVPLYMIDSLVSTGAISWPDIIKIDVEGSELAVLKGAIQTLLQTRHLFIELHPTFISWSGGTVKQVEDLINDLGFTCQFKHERENGDNILCYFNRS